MSKIVSRLPGLWLALLLLVSGPLLAHEARPIYLQINELDSGQAGLYRYQLKLNLPPSVEADNRPYLSIPESCQRQHSGLILMLECATPLNGQTIAIDFPKFNPSLTTLARIAYRSGGTQQTLLSPEEREWRIPAPDTASAVAAEYTALGIEHILAGWDHLLFLLCLLMISGSLKRTLITVSGFTLSHSLTLVLTTLGLVRLPVAPVEAVIALSILFLAAEIARNQRSSLAWRYPVVVSTVFGLVHGFGFAAVLHDIGLPETELPTALLCFNIGVEIGQVLFVVAAMTLVRLLNKWSARPRPLVPQVLMYGTGSLAAFWTIERIAGF